MGIITVRCMYVVITLYTIPSPNLDLLTEFIEYEIHHSYIIVSPR